MPISAQHTKYTYNDYVNPISLDFFVDTVSKKQQMYDEGRSLVQRQLDTYDSFIDQLERPEDKAYAEQEVAKLTDAINQHAGLDFSNKSNLQAVLNIGKPLEKDQTLLNGIKSTKTYNDLITNFQKLDPSSRAAENDALFYENINKWKSDPNAGAVLSNQPYKPYQKGVVDKYGQVIKDLKPVVETVQSQTPDGRWITTTKISSVDAGRVHDAYMGVLTPAEKEQLAISARYKMNQVGKDAVAKDYLLNQTSTYKGLETAVKENEAKYEQAKRNNKETDPDMIQFKSKLDNLRMQRDVMAKRAMVSPDQIDEGVLVNHLINEDIMNTAGSLAYKEVENKIDTNAYGLENYKSANNMREYENKKKLDLIYAAEADRLGLDISGTGSGKAKPLVGYTDLSATDEKTLNDLGKYDPKKELSQGHLQTFTDLTELDPTQNQALNAAIWNLSQFKLSPTDKQSLIPAVTQDPKTKATIPAATVQDMLDIANAENSLGHKKLAKVFAGAGGAETKEKFLWKLKGIAQALEKAKNSPGVNITYTAADNANKNYKRTLPLQEFLNEPAGAVFTQINDIYVEPSK